MSGVASRRLRVCLVGPSLDILGGQSVQLVRLRDALAACPELHVGVISVNPRLPGKLARLQAIRYVRTAVTSIAYLLELVRKLPFYDIVHCYSASYWSFLIAPVPAMLVGRLCGRKVLLNYHSGEAEGHLRRAPRLVPMLMRLADCIVVPSPFLARVFAASGLTAIVIPNSIDTTSLRWRERLSPRPRILANRNLESLYAVHHVITALLDLQRHFPEASLTVAGDGAERGRLEAQVRDLGLHNVTFLGRVEPTRMPELYDDADIYVNASLIDNMPLSLIEASLAGIPIVTTDAGGIPDMLDHGRSALVVPRDDPKALANGILRVLREPGLGAALAKHAYDDARVRYDSVRLGRIWAECYRDVCREGLTG
jgi:glycosyltransferase involved in cell wall biosynthesis